MEYDQDQDELHNISLKYNHKNNELFSQELLLNRQYTF